MNFYKVFSLLIFLCPIILFGQKNNPEELVKKDWPNTYTSFGSEVDKIPLNFIFVLDISDKTFGNQIKNVVKDFLKPVKNGDYFNVILLGNTDKTINLTECAIVNDEKKKGIIKQVDSQVFGTIGSDGVKMTNLVIDAMNCAGAKDATPIVFIFSDFVHYSKGWSVPGNQFWSPLKKKYEKQKNLNSYFYCIELPNVDKKPKYISKIREIFENANTVTCDDPNLLNDRFNNIKANLIKSLLLDLVKKKVIEEQKNLVMIYDNNEVSLSGKDSLVYSKIILNEESKSKVEKIVKSDLLYSFFPQSEIEIEVSGTLIADMYNKELSELTDVTLTNHKIRLMTADSIIPWWLTDIIVLILIISILRIIWVFIPTKLDGMVTFSSSENFDASQSNFNAKSKKTVTIGYGREYANDSKLFSSEDFCLKIIAKKKFIKGKCIELSPINGDLRSRNGKITIQRGTSVLVDKISSWNINGVTIGLPNVK
jgi:hypothetical protein